MDTCSNERFLATGDIGHPRNPCGTAWKCGISPTMENKLQTQADQQLVLSGAVDPVGPWTIKSVATATRDAAITAARKEGLTVGQWLERRVREWTEEGGSAQVVNMSYPATEAGMAEALAAARLVETLAGAGVPITAGVVRGCLALISERLRGARGLPPITPRKTSQKPGQTDLVSVSDAPA